MVKSGSACLRILRFHMHILVAIDPIFVRKFYFHVFVHHPAAELQLTISACWPTSTRRDMIQARFRRAQRHDKAKNMQDRPWCKHTEFSSEVS
jgi:hypothetical protein